MTTTATQTRIIRPVNGTGYTAGKSPRDYLLERMAKRRREGARRRAVVAALEEVA